MYYLFTGGYGDEIICHKWSNDHSTPLWSIYSKNPSFLAFHPSLPILYAANELSDKIEISAYSYTSSGAVLLNTVTCTGAGLCHIYATDKAIYGAAYNSGHVIAFALNSDGLLGHNLNHIKHLGHGSHDRQESAHAHQCILDPLKNFLIAVDLGTNCIYSYAIKLDGALDETSVKKCLLPPSEGPRHMVFDKSGEYSYLITEMLNKVYKLSYKNGEFEILSSVELVAPDVHITSAAINFHPTSDTLFTSVRGANHIISLSCEKLNIINKFDCMGDSPRMFAFSPDGKYLFVANQSSNCVSVFSVDNNQKLNYHSKIAVEAVSFIHCLQI